MKAKIGAAFLSVVLLANTSVAVIETGALVSMAAVTGGVVGTVVAFLPSLGDAGHWEADCGPDVPQCSAPVCSKREYCFTPSNLGRPFCWYCHGNGTGHGGIASRRYEGTAWGVAVAFVSLMTVVVGGAGSIYYAKTGCTSGAEYENL